MVELCKHVPDPHNKTTEIEAFIGDMIEPAEKGAKESKEMASSFREVQRGLWVVCSSGLSRELSNPLLHHRLLAQSQGRWPK